MRARRVPVAEKHAALDGRGRSASAVPDEGADALFGEDRARGYNRFFVGLVPKLRESGFDNGRKAPSRSWYNFSTGHGMSSKVQYCASFNRDAKARVELYLDMDKDSNEKLFNHLFLECEPVRASGHAAPTKLLPYVGVQTHKLSNREVPQVTHRRLPAPADPARLARTMKSCLPQPCYEIVASSRSATASCTFDSACQHAARCRVAC